MELEALYLTQGSLPVTPFFCCRHWSERRIPQWFFSVFFSIYVPWAYHAINSAIFFEREKELFFCPWSWDVWADLSHSIGSQWYDCSAVISLCFCEKLAQWHESHPSPREELGVDIWGALISPLVDSFPDPEKQGNICGGSSCRNWRDI